MNISPLLNILFANIFFYSVLCILETHMVQIESASQSTWPSERSRDFSQEERTRAWAQDTWNYFGFWFFLFLLLTRKQIMRGKMILEVLVSNQEIFCGETHSLPNLATEVWGGSLSAFFSLHWWAYGGSDQVASIRLHS